MYSLHPVLMLTIYRILMQLSNQEINIGTISSVKLSTLFEFCQFILYCPFSIPWSNPGSYIAFSCISLVSSNLWQFLNLYFSFMALGLLIRLSLILGLPSVFYWLDWGYTFSYYHRSEAVSFLVHHFRGRMMLIGLITGDVNLEHIVRVVSVEFLHCKITVFPFVIDILGEILWDSANILFPLQLSPTGSNIHE